MTATRAQQPSAAQIEEFRREHFIHHHIDGSELMPWAVEQNMVLTYLCDAALAARTENAPTREEMLDLIEKSGAADEIRAKLRKGFEAARAARSASATTGETPRTDAVLASFHAEYQVLTSHGRSLRDLCRQLERELALARESLRDMTERPDYSPRSSSAPTDPTKLRGEERQRYIHEHDCPKAWEFYSKHASGSKLCPSCFMCGQQYPDRNDWAITHMELPDIYICKPCRDTRSTLGRSGPCKECVNMENCRAMGRCVQHG